MVESVMYAILTDEEWDALLEAKMRALTVEIDALVQGDIHQKDHSLMRTYLYRARYALVDGVAWYDYFRKKHGDLPELKE